MNSTRFFIGLIGIAVILFCIAWILAKTGTMPSASYRNTTLLVTTIITALIFFFLNRTDPRQPLDFVHNFLLTVVLKIILSGFYVFIFLRLDPANANTNVVVFLIAYFLFTAYETWWFVIKKNAE